MPELSLTEKLNSINNSKQAIKQALIDKRSSSYRYIFHLC